MRLLVVEDHPSLAAALVQGLKEAGYAVDLAKDGEEALHCARGAKYDAVLLDLMLPKLDGFGVLKQLRADGSEVPVLALTARDAVEDRVKGLDHGADDYLVKPFAFDELKARVRALVRRGYGRAKKLQKIADLELDPASRTATRAGKPLALSAREFALLEYLAARRDQVVSRSEILEHLYDLAEEPQSNVVDVYVGYLRRKLDDGHPLKLLQTHRGLGYSLGVPE